MAERFDAARALRVLLHERPTVCFMVPTMFQLVSGPEFATADLDSLRWAISGGAPLPAQVYDRWRAKVPIFKQGYGLTEVGPNNFATPDNVAGTKPGTVGRLTYFASARIVGEDGADVAVGRPGELLLAGPHMCAGYWGRPDATADAIRDGWFHTGDIARTDDDGYYYIVDRKKDMIITGGENVFPSEVENVLYSHVAVRQCAVVGLPDPVWGEAVTAVVAFHEGMSVSMEDLLTYARQNLARYKVPKTIVVVPALPVTGTNKISRAEAVLAMTKLQIRRKREDDFPDTRWELFAEGDTMASSGTMPVNALHKKTEDRIQRLVRVTTTKYPVGHNPRSKWSKGSSIRPSSIGTRRSFRPRNGIRCRSCWSLP